MLITPDMRYINLPVNKTAEKSKIRFYENSKLIFDIDVQLDFKNPDCVMPYDIRNFIGHDIKIIPENGVELTFTADCGKTPTDSLRPEIHFTADYGWINDPNGLVYYEGKYHLFFQHNPAGLTWANMHWGHAVSEDLVCWTQLECALFPDDLGDMFSGSAIVDKDNLLGLKTGTHDTVVLFYTAAGEMSEFNKNKKFSQCIAYSADGAKTFIKYDKNPIIPTIKPGNRDPKVIFDSDSGMYIMALYIGEFEYGLFKSSNLTKWEKISSFKLGDERECPDFYPLYDGDEKKWIFTGANDYYYIGDFDIDKGFINISKQRKFGFGSAYAAQSWSNAEDRKLRISWSRFANIYSKHFTSAMSIPCEVYLNKNRLRIKPAAEFDALFNPYLSEEDIASNGYTKDLTSYVSSIKLKLSDTKEKMVITLFETKIELDFNTCEITLNEQKMPLYTKNGEAELRIITDNIGIEIFSCDLAFGIFETINTGKDKHISFEGTGRIAIEISEY